MAFPFVTCKWHPGERLGYAACVHLVEGHAVAVSVEAPSIDKLGSALCAECTDQTGKITVDQLRLVCETCFDLHIAARVGDEG